MYVANLEAKVGCTKDVCHYRWGSSFGRELETKVPHTEYVHTQNHRICSVIRNDNILQDTLYTSILKWSAGTSCLMGWRYLIWESVKVIFTFHFRLATSTFYYNSLYRYSAVSFYRASHHFHSLQIFTMIAWKHTEQILKLPRSLLGGL